jgi:hypothetical protein
MAVPDERFVKRRIAVAGAEFGAELHNESTSDREERRWQY